MRLTDEQRRAVERRDGPLFLHAGAGSGKTRVLVERLVQSVLDDGVPVERLLAITFTDKAAAELKGRVRERFIELGRRDLARDAESAWISTIHGFCSRVLRASALAAGIDPDYVVLDQARAARLAIEAFDGALERFLRVAGSDERLDLVASYTPDKLERMVRTVHDHLRSRGETRPRLAPLPDPPGGAAERARLESALRAAQEGLAGVEMKKSVLTALERIGGCSEALTAVPAGELGDAEVFSDLRVTNRGATALKTPAFDELDEALSVWVRACAARKAHAHYALLAKLLDGFTRRYADAKDKRSALDFEDLQLYTRDLLKRDRALRTELSDRFEQVMVDEFQDTNPLQNEILDLVARDNLFAVGDDRQSIYGFRHADVSVFRERRDRAEAAGRAESLSASFRARPELICAINAAFGFVWDDYRPLAVPPEAPAPDPVGAAPRVELLVVDKSRPRWEDALGEEAFGESMSGVPPWRAAEARLLAKRIDELTSDGGYECGDVAVLLRAASDMAAYEHALQERGIPTYAVGGGGYWVQQQTADLRSYLSALANPRDELALYSVLASPLVGVSLDALAVIRARKHERDVWWAFEQAFGPDGDGSDGLADALPDGDREKIAAFVARFSAERRAAPRMSLETLIDRAVSASGYDLAILALPDGARRMANVRKLMRLAREWEAEAGRDLRGFIDFVGERELLEAREGDAPLEGEGLAAVRLMTIHAAKGLEFPVVCVADLGRDATKDHGTLQISEDGRAGLEVASLGGGRQSAMDMDEIKAEREREAEEEEKRIFYVAMTRAERQLVVSGALDTEKWRPHEALGPPLEWVWPALAPGAKLLFESASDDVEAHDGVRVRCVLCSPQTVDDVLPERDRAPAARLSPEPEASLAEPAVARSHLSEALHEATSLPVARLSYSGLGDYKRCGYRFYLERVVGMRLPPATGRPEAEADPVSAGPEEDGDQLALAPSPPEPEAPGLPPLLYGTVVHELLERVDFRRPIVPAAVAVEECIRAHGAFSVAADVESVRASIGRLLGSGLAARVGAARRVRTELPFAFDLTPPGAGGQSLLLNGVVDVYAEEGDRLLVVDYKTDALAGREPRAIVEQRYGTQRLVYALAGLRSGAGRVEVLHCFLEDPERLPSAVFEAGETDRLEAELLGIAAGVVAGRFEPTREPHRELCQGCPAQPQLCIWGPDRTLAEEPPAAAA